MKWIGFVVGIVIIAIIVVGPLMSRVEQPKYEVLEKDGSFELRAYQSQIIAEVCLHGERKDVIKRGFRILADYIFGKNSLEQSISMTAPVEQEKGEEIAMTAPVVQEEDLDESGRWCVRFAMPVTYTLATLPKPLDPAIKIKALPPRRQLALQFSGAPSEETLADKRLEVMEYAEKKGFEVVGRPAYAFYNPPWTLPFLRRNEVLVEIE